MVRAGPVLLVQVRIVPAIFIGSDVFFLNQDKTEWEQLTRVHVVDCVSAPRFGDCPSVQVSIDQDAL